MADYSANATQLPEPSGAGAAVVSPVQQQYIPNNIVPLLGDVVNVFAQGYKASQKADAEKRKQDVVGQYVKSETIINDAVAQGLDAGQAAARSRANANKFFASYPEYAGDFEAAGKALKGLTEKGEVEEQLKSERALYQQQIGRAQAAGYTIDPSMPKGVIDLQLNAYDVSVRGQADMERQYKASAEIRANNAEGRAVEDRNLKNTSIRVINEIASSRMEAAGGFISNLAADVASGKLPYEQAAIKLTQEFSTINSTIQSAASVNPELAGPYRTLFSDMQKLGQELIDPKKKVENSTALLTELINKSKLLIVAEPQNAAIVAASQLLGANAETALAASKQLTPYIAKMINTPAGAQGYVPQVVGNPEVQGDAIKFLKSSLNKLDTPAYSNPDKARGELTNAINQTLTQVGTKFGPSMSATELKDWAQFFAGPEYGKFSTGGTLDKQAAQAANQTFQLNYEPTIIQGVHQKLETYLQGQASFGQKQGAPVELGSVIGVEFSGSGIKFIPKARPGLDPQESLSQARGVKDLNTTATAINQLIHIGAHLEGTTDYKKYWEERKHVWLPTIYPHPNVLKEGQTVDGYTYIGGAYGDPRSWRPASK